MSPHVDAVKLELIVRVVRHCSVAMKRIIAAVVPCVVAERRYQCRVHLYMRVWSGQAVVTIAMRE